MYRCIEGLTVEEYESLVSVKYEETKLSSCDTFNSLRTIFTFTRYLVRPQMIYIG